MKNGGTVWLCNSHLSRFGEVSRVKQRQGWLENLPREQSASSRKGAAGG